MSMAGNFSVVAGVVRKVYLRYFREGRFLNDVSRHLLSWCVIVEAADDDICNENIVELFLRVSLPKALVWLAMSSSSI